MDVGGVVVLVDVVTGAGMWVSVAVGGMKLGGGGGVPHRDNAGWQALGRKRSRIVHASKRGVVITPQIILFSAQMDCAH